MAMPTCWWCGQPYPDRGRGFVGAEYCSSVCLDAATEAAEARDQAAHQAARDRDREPDRWPTGTGRPSWPPAPGSPEYLEADSRWQAHLRERTAGAGDDLTDLIDR
jgi:hypothetical protein